MSGGAIAGIVVGSVAVAILLSLLVYCLSKSWVEELKTVSLKPNDPVPSSTNIIINPPIDTIDSNLKINHE